METGGLPGNTIGEILVKDKNGAWGIWHDGQWIPAEQPGTPQISKTSAASVIPSSDPSTGRTVGVEPVTIGQPDPVDEIARRIIQDLHVSLPTPDLRPRLENAVRLRLKDVRDTVDTREVLRKPITEGGLGFSDDVSDAIVQAIMNVQPQMHQAPHAQSFPERNQASSESESNAPSSITTSVLYRTPSASEPLVPAPIIPPAPPLSVISGGAPPIAPAPVSQAPAQPVVAPARPTMKLPENTVARPASMVDVRSRPAAVGPVDELKLFTLLDFRRLDPDPKRAATRLIEKVKLLEDESYEKMVDGVRAWRQSPLHALYLSIGQESLTTNRPVATVIEARKTAGETTLTPLEFETVMELNKNLRF